MSIQLKHDPSFGLGAAIGDKASHLFTKNYVSIYDLKRRSDKGWSELSYEVPFDSNVGRVLFRTGFFLEWTTLDVLRKKEVIQKEKGKHGVDYIRVTNIRGLEVNSIPNDSKEFLEYTEIVRDYLKAGIRPRQIEIQRLANLLVYELNKQDKKYSLADLDDGLMEVGTGYCFNTPSPRCSKCPVRHLCRGYNQDKKLITDYMT